MHDAPPELRLYLIATRSKGGFTIDVLGGSWHSFRMFECCAAAFREEEARQAKRRGSGRKRARRG